MRRLLAIGVALQLLQQLCGLNMFLFYGPRIFEALGESAFAFSAAQGCVLFASTLPALALVDRVGRVALLRWSAAGMLIACVALAGVGELALGGGGGGGDPPPAAAGALACAAIFAFLFAFSFGWGPVVWVYCAEMFPLAHRAKATGLTTMTNWAGNFCVGFFPPILFSSLGFRTFWIFAGTCALCLAAACALPETRGKSLEERLAASRASAGSRRGSCVERRRPRSDRTMFLVMSERRARRLVARFCELTGASSPRSRGAPTRAKRRGYTPAERGIFKGANPSMHAPSVQGSPNL